MQFWSALCYFDFFQYPLTAAQVHVFSPEKADLPDVEAWLRDAVQAGYLQEREGLYQLPATLRNTRHDVEIRKAQEHLADQMRPKALRMGQLIAAFPFVRAVMISGSMSKHCMRPDSDVDFFIVTAPGRLWVARSLLILFKKVCLLNSRKFFCVNYFVDTDHLEIEEKNLFTATEIITLLPLAGREWYEAFMAANTWVSTDFFPNGQLRSSREVPVTTTSPFKTAAEWLLNGKIGTYLEHWTMKTTVGYWRKKFKHFDNATFEQALKSRKYVSKHHPLGFQEKVLTAHKNLLAIFASIFT